MIYPTRVNVSDIKCRLRRQGRLITKFTLTFPPQLADRAWNEEYERMIIENNKQHF